MQCKIEVKVTLPSGAKIEITPDQRSQIEALVERVVFRKSRPVLGGGASKAILGRRVWTDDELQTIMDKAEGLNGLGLRERHRAVVDLARQFGRTPASVNTMVWKMTHTSNPQDKQLSI